MPTLNESVEAFLRKFPNVTPSRIGAGAIRDPNLVRQLRSGRYCNPQTTAAVRKWMAGYAKAARAAQAREERARRRAAAATQAEPEHGA